MSRHANAIAGRLSLRPPQERSLEILDRATKIVPPKKGTDLQAGLEAIQREFPTVTDFEREFPSLCFALATGVGKTRLMGAFISYLHLAHGLNNFFVLAPNLTVYNKLIADFTPNTPKYVFKGIAEFATDLPEIITGDNYEAKAGTLFDQTVRCKINIFNISKINSEVRGGNVPRIKRLSEYIGDSYFNYLAELPDLVLLMDESHRYRASAGIEAINQLKPTLGLELTATPFIGTTIQNRKFFKNVIFDYPLAKGIEDGFLKEPAVVTRRDFSTQGMSEDEVERIKLEDGIRLHSQLKVSLETFARENERQIVKPFVLVIAQDTTHATELLKLIQSDSFFEGRYKEKVIQVDSKTKEEEYVDRLLKVENTDEPTEIVIHVNMLQEGWDVRNLYTIIPLRAASAPRLIEQTIGRGLRLPYGKRTGVNDIDRLNIIAHDKFQEIIDESNKPNSSVRLQQIIIAPEKLGEKLVTMISQPILNSKLGIQPEHIGITTQVATDHAKPEFAKPEEQKIAQIAHEALRRLENDPKNVPNSSHLLNPKILNKVIAEVKAEYASPQLELEGVDDQPDISAIVKRTAELVIEQTIDMPRIVVLPKGEVKSGFKSFRLDFNKLKYDPVSEDLWVQHLRTNENETLSIGHSGISECRLEDYIVSGLRDFDDVSYDDHADLLYELARQTVDHFKGYLPGKEVVKVLRCYQKPIAKFIHIQMQSHFWEEATGYDILVSKGFDELKPCAYTALADASTRDFRQPVDEKSQIGQVIFNGFHRCLYPILKFQSDTERRLAVVLDRDSIKWFKPMRGQFQLSYRWDGEHSEYQPDFVAETKDSIFMIETKAVNEMEDPIVKAKKDIAIEYCKNASAHTQQNGGKPWKYLLIPHDAVAENMTLSGLGSRFL
jgi:type III restriction enzyme